MNVMPIWGKGEKVVIEATIAEDVLATAETTIIQVVLTNKPDETTDVTFTVPTNTLREVSMRSRALSEVPVDDRPLMLWARLAMDQPRHSPRSTLWDAASRLEDLHEMTIANGWGECTTEKCVCGDAELIERLRTQAR